MGHLAQRKNVHRPEVVCIIHDEKAQVELPQHTVAAVTTDMEMTRLCARCIAWQCAGVLKNVVCRPTVVDINATARLSTQCADGTAGHQVVVHMSRVVHMLSGRHNEDKCKFISFATMVVVKMHCKDVPEGIGIQRMQDANFLKHKQKLLVQCILLL